MPVLSLRYMLQCVVYTPTRVPDTHPRGWCPRLTAWFLPGLGSGDSLGPWIVSLMVCGDEQAMMFHATHGEIPERECRIWDNEMNTLHTEGKQLSIGAATSQPKSRL